MFKAVNFLAVPASLSFATLHVHASSEIKAPQKTLIKVEELSLYSSPSPETRYVEDKKTELEEGISWLRTSTAPYTKWCQVLSHTPLSEFPPSYWSDSKIRHNEYKTLQRNDSNSKSCQSDTDLIGKDSQYAHHFSSTFCCSPC